MLFERQIRRIRNEINTTLNTMRSDRYLNAVKDFLAIERMRIANTPELQGYISLTDYLRIKGIDENGKESWKAIWIEKYFAAHDKNLEIMNQEWFDQIKKFEIEAQKIRLFFNSKLRIFLSRSLNVFFETFPELEKFYIYVNPLERNKAGRELMAPEQIENMRNAMKEFLS